MRIQTPLLRLKAVSSGAFSHPVRLIGFTVVAVVAPILMLANGGNEPSKLPWSFWAIVALAGLGMMSIGFLRFLLESPEAETISIRPARKSMA
jgi:hypothetical protein